MSYGQDKQANTRPIGSLVAAGAAAAVASGGVGAATQGADRVPTKNSVLQNLTSRLEGQCSAFENQVHQLTRIVDRLTGGGGEAAGRTDPPPAYSCVGALTQLCEINDDRLKAFAYQLSRLEEAV